MLWPDILVSWRGVARDKLQEVLARLRSLRGRPATAEEDTNRLQLSDLLSTQQAARQRLGGRLDEALTFAPLPGGDARFSGRSDSLEQLRLALDAWQEGQPRMLACHGPQGTGVSTLLNQIGQLAGPETVLQHHVLQQRLSTVENVLALCGELFQLAQPPVSVEEALTLVREAPARIVVMDNAHHFVLRIAGNAPVIRTLGMLMVASRQRHLWVLGCNTEAWNRLIYVHGIDRYFTDIILLTPFGGEELAAMLTQRLQWAEVGIAIEADTVEASGRHDDTPFAAGSPGELLVRLSNGYPQLAIGLLISALVPGDDAKHFTLSPAQKPSTEILDKLLPAELFALAEIAVHGGLSALEHKTIFRTPMTDSQILLDELCQRQLLYRQASAQPGQETYHLHPVIASIITTHLYKKNLLY